MSFLSQSLGDDCSLLELRDRGLRVAVGQHGGQPGFQAMSSCGLPGQRESIYVSSSDAGRIRVEPLRNGVHVTFDDVWRQELTRLAPFECGGAHVIVDATQA
jgi:hypothetical protein